jgi:hypothetical protein
MSCQSKERKFDQSIFARRHTHPITGMLLTSQVSDRCQFYDQEPAKPARVSQAICHVRLVPASSQDHDLGDRFVPQTLIRSQTSIWVTNLFRALIKPQIFWLQGLV